MNPIDIIGWSSAAILLFTIGRQVYTQWRTRSTQGLSKWLFIGQIATSLGFVVYSFLLQNWVFVTTNAFIAAAAVAGQWLYLRNRQVEAARRSKTEPGREAHPRTAPAPSRAGRQPDPSRSKPGVAPHPGRRKANAGTKDRVVRKEPALRPAPQAKPDNAGTPPGEGQIRAVPPSRAMKRPPTRRARNIPPA